MKTIIASTMIFLSALAIVVPTARVQAAESDLEVLERVRASYKTDRQAFLAEHLPLTESESAAFWPLYRSYREDMEKLGDELLKLILEYSDTYPDVPEERAKELLKQYTALEEKLTAKRNSYFKKAAKSLPAAKVLRWAQLENRLDLALRMQLAGNVPLVPAAKPPKQ